MKNCDCCLNNLIDDDGEHYCTYMGSMDEDEMVHMMARDDAADGAEPGDANAFHDPALRGHCYMR